VLSILLFTLIPATAAIGGGALAAFAKPGPKLTSAVQHFAAGVVFAAAAGELLPDILRTRSLVPVIVGSAIGLALMLFVKWLGCKARGPVSLVAVVGVDILVDGLVLGIGFTAGGKVGLLLTIALTLEVLFLGLAVAEPLREANGSRRLIVVVTAGLALLLPLGAAVGVPLGRSSQSMQTGLFAFGLMALLYLVTEELLVEAHEKPDTPFITAAFFVGFLLLIALEEQIG
jgi:ZIP family zinc transporter